MTSVLYEKEKRYTERKHIGEGCQALTSGEIETRQLEGLRANCWTLGTDKKGFLPTCFGGTMAPAHTMNSGFWPPECGTWISAVSSPPVHGTLLGQLQQINACMSTGTGLQGKMYFLLWAQSEKLETIFLDCVYKVSDYICYVCVCVGGCFCKV